EGPAAPDRRREDRLRLREVDVADEGRAAGLLRAARTVRCPSAPNRAPPTEGAHKVGHVAGEPLTRRAELRASPALDPPIRIHEAAQEVETRFPRGVQVDVRDERLIAPNAPETEPPERLHESVR